jgi:hypothetical protein
MNTNNNNTSLGKVATCDTLISDELISNKFLMPTVYVGTALAPSVIPQITYQTGINRYVIYGEAASTASGIPTYTVMSLVNLPLNFMNTNAIVNYSNIISAPVGTDLSSLSQNLVYNSGAASIAYTVEVPNTHIGYMLWRIVFEITPENN